MRPAAALLRLGQSASIERSGGTAEALAPLDGALLAWLAIEGPTPRARLAVLLWPGKSAEAARNSLRQRLFRLRRDHGELVLEDGGIASLAPRVSHDLHEAQGVLDGVELDIGGDFAAWLEQSRTRLRQRRRQQLAERCELAEEGRDLAAAIGHANELLALEPLSEEAHRRLMRLHYLAGDRAAALLAFDRCEQLLKDEIGTRPSAATMALLETVNAAQAAPLPASGTAVPASVLRPPLLVGRQDELQALAAAHEAGHVAALVGEAGMGKTRLLQAFIGGSGGGAVYASARPGDAGVPFALLARLLRAVLAHGEAAGSGLAVEGLARGEIARVLPEFDAGTRPGGEGQRLVLLRALRTLLARSPVALLVVDDLHFADEASLDMLGGLIDSGDTGEAGAADRTPPRWALAWRPAEAGSPLQALHDNLVEQVRLVATELRPLDEAALAALVDSLALPGVRGAAIAAGLMRRTGGNPLFVLETLKQAWVEQDLQSLAGAGTLPRALSVGRLIERRIARLSPPALALARVASIAGVDFCIALAEQVLRSSAMQFADALNELEAAQVLRGTAFAHDLVFDAVRASVPQPIARHTHARVAEWLEQQACSEPARVARHWLDAGEPARALPWLGRAAEAAGAAVRRKEQLAFLDLQSRLLESEGDRNGAFEAQMRAAEIEVTLDDGAGADSGRCERLEALAYTPTQRVHAAAQRANRAIMRGETGLAAEVAEAALREALREGVGAEPVAQCRLALATALSAQTRLPEAVAQFEAAIAWVDEHGSDALRCELHANLASTQDRLGQLRDGEPHHRLGAELALRVGDNSNQAITLSNWASNRAQAGQLAEALALLARARLVHAQAAEASSVSGFIAMEEAVVLRQSGRYASALRAIDEGERNLLQFAPGYADRMPLHRAACWAQMGQWARAGQVLAALGPLDQLPLRQLGQAVLLTRQCEEAAGRPPDAAVLQAALQRLGDGGANHLVMALRVEQALRAGDDAARQAVAEVTRRAMACGLDGMLLSALAASALLGARAGDAAAARAEAARALALAGRATSMHTHPLAPLLHLVQALVLLGDAAAKEPLQRAQAWIAAALPEVPEAFRESFLQRHPVTRELALLAARLIPR